ncbi:MAG: hypothetical protein IPI24_08530 [Ignavibacteria bacterium]|nr:hypothetical protein [Ignavibacteria bacterium]
MVSPSKYRAAAGTLSDAEYVMTQTPISITGLVRNIGGLPQTNTPIRLRVYLETPASNNGALATAQWNGSAVVDRIVNATINSGDEVNVVYDLTWVPQSYQQLAAWAM